MPVIRPAKIDDARAIARVHVDTWRTTYSGIVPDEHLSNLSYDNVQANWLKYLSNPESETHVFVTEDETSQIVAFASGGPLREPLDNYDGELYVLYVWKSFQRVGYGKLLVSRVAHDLIHRGFHSLVIWVLKENSACRFYEKLGGQKTAEKVIVLGGKELIDVAYVWPDLEMLRGEGYQGEK